MPDLPPTLPTPCSRDAATCAPVSLSVEMVLPKGSTVSTSPTVTSPSSMSARIPPPLVIAMSLPVSSRIASVNRLPIKHSPARQVLLVISCWLTTAVPSGIATAVFFSSLIGLASSSTNACTSGSGVICLLNKTRSPRARVTMPSSSNLKSSRPR